VKPAYNERQGTEIFSVAGRFRLIQLLGFDPVDFKRFPLKTRSVYARFHLKQILFYYSQRCRRRACVCVCVCLRLTHWGMGRF